MKFFISATLVYFSLAAVLVTAHDNSGDFSRLNRAGHGHYSNRRTQDTKAPSTKSTKEPSVKSTKQPSVDSVKSTKQPSVKSTKQPSAKGSKGGKSSTFADSRAGDASSGFMLTDSSNLSLLLACMSGIVGIMVMLA